MDTSRFLKTTTSLQDYLKNKTRSGIGSGGGAGDESETEAFLVNDSNYTIYFQPEGEMTIDGKKYENGGSYPLSPGKSWFYPIDGVTVPQIRKEEVYKSNNGTVSSVTIKKLSWKSGVFLEY